MAGRGAARQGLARQDKARQGLFTREDIMGAITATAHIEGTTPYSQGQHVTEPKLDKESSDAYERRTWRKRLHVDDSGEVYIPPMAFTNALGEAAKYLSLTIPGKGKATYTKHFDAGVLCVTRIGLGVKADAVDYDELFVPADGVRGSGKRVVKLFPRIDPPWRAEVPFMVIDRTITKEVFAHVLEQAGLLIGIGRFRPRNRGYYGRFSIRALEWDDPDA